MNIARLHYITQDVATLSHTQMALDACAGGVDWVQIRIKNQPFVQWKQSASEVKAAIQSTGAKCIINDNVYVALEIGAEGVHLGKSDMSPLDARKILGDKTIIGGTANDWDDIQRLADAGVNYMGVGPFRFTSTKQNLSPILGVQGYEQLMAQMDAHNIKIPVVAIGGIQIEDIPLLIKTGVHGIAVSSAINLSENRTAAAQAFMRALHVL